MAQSLTKSSASLVAAGGDLAEAASLTAVANAIIQDADSVGTALKTTSLRLRGTSVKILEEEGLDTDGAVESTSKLRSQIKALSGVDILTETGEYKSTYEILADIAEVWESINDMDQAALLELISGKRNSSVIAAILQNPQELEDAYKDAMDAEGSALKENEKYLDSIQGKIDQFNNAMQAMWSDTLDSDIVKGLVSLGTELVKIIDKVGLLNVGVVGFFVYLQKQHGLLGKIFKPAETGVEDLRSQLAQAEKDLAKAEAADAKRRTNRTAETKRNAEERVNALKEKVQPYDDVDALRKQREDLLKQQAEARARMDAPETAKEAKKDLADINAQLKQTNKELAEAEVKLAEIDKDFEPTDITDVVDNAFDPKSAKNSITGKKGARTKRINKLQAEGKTFDEIQADPKIKQYTQEIEEAERALNDYNEQIRQANSSQAQHNITNEQGIGIENRKAAAKRQATAAEMASTSATWADFFAVLTHKEATMADVAMSFNKVAVTKLLNTTLGQYILTLAGVTAAEAANMSMGQLLGLGLKGLGKAFVSAALKAGAFIASLGPIAWAIMGITVALTAAVAIFSVVHKTTKELTEELNDMKSELSDLRSEIKDINSELEETNERMAELLAKDKLTFEEQEELDRLRKTNDELERRKELLEEQEKDKAGRVGRQAARVVNSQRKEAGWILNGQSEEAEVISWIEDYKYHKNKRDKASTANERKKQQDKMDKATKEIDKHIAAVSEALDGVEYGDSEESDAALDYLAELESKYAIARGSASAKTNAVKGVFNKDEFSETKEAIDGYVKALSDGDASAKKSIKNIIENNADLVKDLAARGVEAQDAIDYFTKLGSEANYSTIDGKIQEVSRAAATFESLLDGGLFKVDDVDIGLAELFDEEGKVIQTKLSQVFNDTSDQTRKDITYLLEGSYEQIKNGTVDTEKLLTGFGLKTTQQVLDIQNKLLGEQNLELFPNLKDEINGIIDTFSEFSKAVGGVVDALDTLDKARAEEAYSGSISIETLENLMEYTDDYAQLVEIDETGAIRLAADAEEILIRQRIEKIKTDAAAAVQTAQSNLAQAKYNAKAVNETGPVQEALTSATDALAGSWAYLGSLIGDVTDGNFSGMFERASGAYSEATSGREEKRAQVNVSVEDAEEALANALNQQKIANALTSDNVKSKYSSDEASGGNATKEDAEKDLVEKGWEKLLAKYENQLALLSNERDLIQAEIDKAEARGGKASEKYYEDLVNNSTAEKKLLEEKKAALEEYLAANAGAIDQDTWTDYNNEINETAVAIKECEINTIEWAEAMREIDLHYFEQINSEISRLGEELDFVNSLLEDEEVADENGNWSSAALTRIGMYTNQMEMAAANAARYQEEINDLDDEYENGAISEEQYQEKLSDLVSSQQDAIMSYEDAKDSIVELNEARVDAIREGIEKEIEAYGDLIDAKKEELDAERDLYDFRKNIKKQTKDISELERRIASLSGSSAASDVAERRRLEAQLLEAKEGLNDTYYDHSHNAMSAALDEENEAYALSKEKYIERLEEQLKDTETLIQNSIMDVMLNADMVYNELNTMADIYGVTLSDELTQPWKDASAQAVKWKDELKLSMTSGEYAALIGEGGAVTAFANGVATKLKGSWSQAQTAAKNYAGYLTGAELKNRFTNTLTGFGNQIQGIVDKWNAVKAAADIAYAAQTRKVNVGGTGSGNTGGSGSGGAIGAVAGAVAAVTDQPKKAKTMHASGQLYTRTVVPTNLVTTHVTVGGVTYVPIMGTDYYVKKSDAPFGSAPYGTKKYKYYAKGTSGTTRDEWALTDEPQFGDELVLVPGKDGNLSFMRKGTGVVPADLTANLMEWGQFTPDSMNLGGGVNINMINNAVNKPEFNFNVDNFLRCDNVSQDTLPELKKFVKEQMDSMVKQMNYSVKRFAR